MMEEKKELFSEKVSAGSRQYIFDVKKSADGTRYLVIKESRQADGESYKHNQVMVFQEHLLAFRKGFNKAIKFIPREPKPKVYKVEQIRHEHPKAYVKWTKEEDVRLRNEHAQGKTIAELAGMFQRKLGAIRSRLKKLEML